MSENYYKEYNKKNYDKLQELLLQLPEFCKDYFVGIEMKTSMLTQLNYARDLCIFFDYIYLKRFESSLQSPKDITLNDLNKVKAKDIEYFLNYLTYYSYNGIEHENNEHAKARKLSSVRSLFTFFYRKELLEENVASKVNVPKLHEKPIIRLDSEEVEDLLTTTEAEEKFHSDFQDKYNLNTRDRDLAMLTLMLGTGIRVSECVGLNVNDINMDKLSMEVTRKGGNRVTLFFSEEVKEALENYLDVRTECLKAHRSKTVRDAEPDALFLSLQMKRMSVRAVELMVKKYAAAAMPEKQHISPHKLRSTFGTSLYLATRDIYVVAETLGHRDINTTKKHYVAMSENIRREAAEKVTLRKDYNK